MIDFLGCGLIDHILRGQMDVVTGPKKVSNSTNEIFNKNIKMEKKSLSCVTHT